MPAEPSQSKEFKSGYRPKKVENQENKKFQVDEVILLQSMYPEEFHWILMKCHFGYIGTGQARGVEPEVYRN